LLVGLYGAADGQPLQMLDRAGNPAGHFVTLAVSEVEGAP
jgi:hypothetical protein